jgi:hypothetical protein
MAFRWLMARRKLRFRQSRNLRWTVVEGANPAAAGLTGSRSQPCAGSRQPHRDDRPGAGGPSVKGEAGTSTDIGRALGKRAASAIDVAVGGGALIRQAGRLPQAAMASLKWDRGTKASITGHARQRQARQLFPPTTRPLAARTP